MEKPAHGRSHAPAWARGPQTNNWAAKLAQLSLPHGPKLGPAGQQQIAAVHLRWT
jgi:hypothetical protein